MGEVLKKRLKQNNFKSLEQEAFLNLFVTQGVLRQKYDQICLRYNITTPQYNVLRILNGVYPDGHSRGEIISRMIEPAPDVTRIIDKLVKERLVERFVSNEDRRLSVARITKKGISLLEDMNEVIDELDNSLGQKLSKEELKQLSAICEKIYKDEV